MENSKKEEKIKLNREKREKEKVRIERLRKKKYLGEIIREEKPIFESNNLILSPVGSGKSHLIEEQLIPEDFKGKALYLTSNTSLKDSLAPESNKERKENASKDKHLGFFTSSNRSKFGNVPYSVHVMTYFEFGSKLLNPNETFVDDIEIVFCDEIHSLPKYLTYDKGWELGLALNWLVQKHKCKTIYYFTATNESIINLEKKFPGMIKNIKTFNYLNHPNIRKYIAKSTYFISHINQLRPHLKARLEAFEYFGTKALAFTKFIEEQEKIEKIAIEEGFKPLVLWSINNKKEMSEEQIKARNFILSTGYIPEEYNILIINGSMQEGWNLYDDRVELAILDTYDMTEQVQSLGRIRKDIDLVIKKTKEKEEIFFDTIPSSYLNIPLTAEDKRNLCEELYVVDDRGILKKWTSIRKLILKEGYKIEDKTVTIEGNRKRVSIITE